MTHRQVSKCDAQIDAVLGVETSVVQKINTAANYIAGGEGGSIRLPTARGAKRVAIVAMITIRLLIPTCLAKQMIIMMMWTSVWNCHTTHLAGDSCETAGRSVRCPYSRCDPWKWCAPQSNIGHRTVVLDMRCAQSLLPRCAVCPRLQWHEIGKYSEGKLNWTTLFKTIKHIVYISLPISYSATNI